MVPNPGDGSAWYGSSNDFHDESQNEKKGVASLQDLRDLCIEAEVKLIACQMTVDLFDFKREDLISDIDFGGAATFFEFAGEADITLYV